MTEAPRADLLIEQLIALRSPERQKASEWFFKTGQGEYGEGDQFLGLTMGQVRALGKAYADLAPAEIETLLESPYHEVRACAVTIMDAQAKSKRTSETRRKELFDLYLRRTDRINNWDLVDISAPAVVGGYLVDKPRAILSQLARSASLWERRIAITATAYFIRQGQLDDTYAIAEILLADRHDLIHKSVGWWLRETGKRDRARLLQFLDQHAATMPRTMLRYAIEHLDADLRQHYLQLGRPRRSATVTSRTREAPDPR